MATGTSGDERDDKLTEPTGEVPEPDAADTSVESEDDAAEADRQDKRAVDKRKKGSKTPTRREGELKAKKEQSSNPVARFFREVMAELKKVVTPTRKELWRYVGVVLGFLVIVMILVALLDFIFNYASSWVFGTGSSLNPFGASLDPGVPGLNV